MRAKENLEFGFHYRREKTDFVETNVVLSLHRESTYKTKSKQWIVNIKGARVLCQTKYYWAHMCVLTVTILLWLIGSAYPYINITFANVLLY